MQIYCYSIIQFVAAYFARTLIPYNAAVVSITALLPETLKWYPTPVLSRDHVLRGRIIYYTPKYTLKLSVEQARCNEIYRDATKHARLGVTLSSCPLSHRPRVLKVSRD